MDENYEPIDYIDDVNEYVLYSKSGCF